MVTQRTFLKKGIKCEESNSSKTQAFSCLFHRFCIYGNGESRMSAFYLYFFIPRKLPGKKLTFLMLLNRKIKNSSFILDKQKEEEDAENPFIEQLHIYLSTYNLVCFERKQKKKKRRKTLKSSSISLKGCELNTQQWRI